MGDIVGLIRKAASISTFGAVKYTSRREAETKERLANARLAKAQLVQVKRAEDEEKAASAREAAARSPWYLQPTLADLIRVRREEKRARNG